MDPLILLLINCIVFALPILFGVFTAKRLNFIHGFLVAIDWYVFVTGFYLLALHFNNTAFFANIVDFFNLYFEYFLSVPLKVANSLVTNLSNSFDWLKNYIDVIYLVVPTIIWLISGFFARLFRKSKS